MRKELLRFAILIPVGVFAIVAGRTWQGIAVLLVGLASLVYAWRRLRDLPPDDPVLNAAIDKAMQLEKTDPAAATQLLDKAFAEAEQREQRALAELRARAA